MQNDLCAGGRNGSATSNLDATQEIVGPIKELIREARAARVPVIFARFILTEHSVQRNNPRHLPGEDGQLLCKEGTWGADWYQIFPEPGDAVVTKHRNSAFIGTDFDSILRVNGTRCLVLTGTRTNICVESTARDGYMLGYDSVIVSDCTSAGSPEAHERGLQGSFGERAMSAEVISAWKARLRPGG
jgi:ureidoacrylate peracid hydrolase